MNRIGAYFAAKAAANQKPMAQDQIAAHVFNEVTQQTVGYLQEQAAAWPRPPKFLVGV